MSDNAQPNNTGTPLYKRMEVFLLFHLVCAIVSIGALYYFVTSSPYLEIPPPTVPVELPLEVTPEPTSDVTAESIEQPFQNTTTPTESESTNETNSETKPSMADFLRAMLLTTMAAGATGGTLCNLRGIFLQYEREYKDQKKAAKDNQPRVPNQHPFPDSLFIPFYIRPPMGIFTGLLSFLLGSLLIEALDTTNLRWLTLSGRLPLLLSRSWQGLQLSSSWIN